MKLFNDSTIATLVAILMLGMAGCNGGSSTENRSETKPDAHSATENEDHNHPDHGPHGGDLIELGGEDYHAEIVHTDNGEIVFYILGSDVKTAIPIDATEVTVNVVHDGTPEQFKVPASPDEGDSEGKSSRFSSADAELSEHVHDVNAQAKLVVQIDGKPFSGNIPHDESHGHSHD